MRLIVAAITQACTSAGKRLPSNAEWQAAVAGTPDPGGDNGTTHCNTARVVTAVNTGSRSSCVSARGAFDMVGNLQEWVADWVPAATTCPGWGGFSNDSMCLAGAATTGGPAALLRGSNFDLGVSGSGAGPLAVNGIAPPSNSAPSSGSAARGSHMFVGHLALSTLASRGWAGGFALVRQRDAGAAWVI